MTQNNKLSQETSPYLLQHSNNPVDWYPWGKEALKKAHDENKPILLSVGYSACHWCHVMAHESFEDESTAEIQNLVSINNKHCFAVYRKKKEFSGWIININSNNCIKDLNIRDLGSQIYYKN